MSRDDDLRVEPRVGPARGRGDGRARRPLSFLQEVNRAVARAGGDPRRLGRARSASPRTGRFNARGRGAKLASSFPREHGSPTRVPAAAVRICGSAVGDALANRAASALQTKAADTALADKLAALNILQSNPALQIPTPGIVAGANALGAAVGNASGIVPNGLIPPVIPGAYGAVPSSAK